MLALAPLLSLAALVAADVTFTLTAKGDNINSPVSVDGQNIFIENGEAATLVLEEPTGFIHSGSERFISTPTGWYLSSGDASRDFGYEDGKLRFGNTVNSQSFWACPDGDKYKIANFHCDNGTPIDLIFNQGGAPPASSSAASTSKPASSAASTTEHHSSSVTPAFHNSTTVTDHHSTLVTVTSCSDDKCTAKPTHSVTTSYEGGAANAKMAAGAVALAGALLL